MQSPPDGTSRAIRFPTGLVADLHYGSETVARDALDLSRTGVYLVGSFPRSVERRVHLTLKSASGGLELPVGGRALGVRTPLRSGAFGRACREKVTKKFRPSS